MNKDVRMVLIPKPMMVVIWLACLVVIFVDVFDADLEVVSAEHVDGDLLSDKN